LKALKNNHLHYKGIYLFFLLAVIHGFSFSQPPVNIDLNRDINSQYDYYLNETSNTHSSIRPYVYSDIVRNDSSAGKISPPTILKNWNKETPHLHLELVPLLSLQPGYDVSHSNPVLETSAGVSLNGYYSDKIAFNLNVLAGNSSYVSYVDSNIKHTGVIPGSGPAYHSNLGYSYQNYSGYLSYSPDKVFNFQVGQGKHFFGDGYRSLFLSDVANNYPYAQITATIWKIKYVCLFAALKDATSPTELPSNFQSKYGAFHYLSWNVTKRLNLNFFEAVIWEGTDSSRTRGYDINYLNPVVFYQPVQYSIGSPDNILMGLGFKLKAFQKQQFYGQLVVDEFNLDEILDHGGWWGNKQGIQLGFKSFDLFKIKSLVFQTEFNYVRPYTYSHLVVAQNYGDFNQPLADPLGANFIESVSFLNYRRGRWTYELKFMAAVYGADENGFDYGQNIFESYSLVQLQGNIYGNYTTQGLRTKLLINDFRVAYLLVPAIHLKIEAGITERFQSSVEQTYSTPFVYLGIRTLFGNFYTDY